MQREIITQPLELIRRNKLWVIGVVAFGIGSAAYSLWKARRARESDSSSGEDDRDDGGE